jgi:hypothetical protein
MQKLAPALALLASLALAAPIARADNVDATSRSTARRLGQEALKLYDAGDYAGALEKLNTADSLVPAPTLGLYAARCLVKLGRLVEASERYLEVTRMQLDRNALPVMRKAQADAVAEREKLLPTIPTLEVRLDGPQGDGTAVTVDDKPLLPALLGEKRPVDPGKHKATAKRADAAVSDEILVRAGDAARLVLKLPPLPPKPTERTPPLRVAGWVGVGVGIAGALLGAVSGAISIAEEQSLLTLCTNGAKHCGTYGAGDSDPVKGKIATYNTVTKLTTAGILVGIAGLGFGIPVLAATPKREWINADGTIAPPPKDGARLRVEPFVTLGGAGVRGIF